jgi:PleD family two-component response regulator
VQSLRLQAPDGTTLALSASIGLAWLQPGIDDAMSLAKAAGNACRSAKVSGKNRLLSYAA